MSPASPKKTSKSSKSLSDAHEHGDWRGYSSQMPTKQRRRLLRRANWEEELDDEQELGIEPISGLKRVGRLFWATVFFLPVNLLLSYTLLRTLYAAREKMLAESLYTSIPVWFTLIGVVVFFCFLIMRILTPVLLWLYVLGHEATHAITSLMCFRGVHSFKVDTTGGYVDTEADNPLVSLSPYFIPLWLILWSALYWGVQLIYPFAHDEKIFYGGFGFWMSFHVYWTIRVIPREQPDLLENGLFFSFLYIALMNLIVLVVILALFELISWGDFYSNLKEAALLFWDLACRFYETLLSLT